MICIICVETIKVPVSQALTSLEKAASVVAGKESSNTYLKISHELCEISIPKPGNHVDDETVPQCI